LSRKQIGLLLTFLIITTLACATSKATPQSGSTDTPSPTATQAGEVVAATPGSGGTTPEAASTDAPTNTPTPGCTFAAAYVADVTVPDDAVFLPNTPFAKTWRIRNSGTCDWESGYLFAYISGDPLGGPASVALPAAVVGANVDVTVNFVSPDAPGTYRSNWQAQTSSGERFGGQFYVQIIVPEPTLAPTIAPTAAPTIAPTAAPVVSDWPTYHNGNKGPNVYALQSLLKAEGASITADGIFGVATQEAVRTFQTAHNLTADGIVGEKTWRALIQNHVLKQGVTGDAVSAAQHLLVNVYGYSNIAVDGIFGPATRNAVKTFQTEHNLTADGIVGENTWKALIVGP